MPRAKPGRKKKERLNEWQPPLEQPCCVNSECELAGQRGQGNLRVRKGKGSGTWRVLRCSKCRSEFSERKGTPLWGTKMPPERAAAIAKHLAEGCGIRKSSRLTGASKNGVTSIAVRVGWHAHELHDESAQDLPVSEAQFDEKWSFVEKKQAVRRDEGGGRAGGRPVGPHCDRRRQPLCRVACCRKTDIREPRGDCGRLRWANRRRPPVLITTDDCANYKDVLLNQYGELVEPARSGRAGRPPGPFKQWPAGAVYATVNKTYGKGRVTEIRRSLVFGTPMSSRPLEGSRSSKTINKHVVRRAAERHGPQLQRPQGAQDLRVLQGSAGSRRGFVVGHALLQLPSHSP